MLKVEVKISDGFPRLSGLGSSVGHLNIWFVSSSCSPLLSLLPLPSSLTLLHCILTTSFIFGHLSALWFSASGSFLLLFISFPSSYVPVSLSCFKVSYPAASLHRPSFLLSHRLFLSLAFLIVLTVISLILS